MEVMTLDKLQGVWKLCSWTHQLGSEDTIYFPFGSKAKGTLEFKGNAFMAHMHKSHGGVSAPQGIKMALYSADFTEFSACGTFELKDTKLFFSYTESALPELMALDQPLEREFLFDGHRTLIISGRKTVDNQIVTVKGTFVRSEDPLQ